MAEILQPSVEIPWASGVSSAPDVEEPSDQLKASGWPRTGLPTPRKTWNWILKRADQGVAHYLQHGVPSYDAAQEYHAGAVVRWTDGQLYQCKATSVSPGQGNPSAGLLWQRISSRTWESTNYSDLLLFDELTASSYDELFQEPDTAVATALRSGVFTRGYGCVLTANTSLQTVTMSSGVVGVGIGTPTSDPQGAEATVFGYTHQNSWGIDSIAEGRARIDVLLFNSSDNRTGNNAWVASTAKGTDVDYTSSPSFPDVHGFRAVGWVRVVWRTGQPSVEYEIHDCMIPLGGGLVSGISFPAVAPNYLSGTWATAGLWGGVTSATGGTALVLPPAELLGGNTARIVGVSISHNLQSGDAITLEQRTLLGGGSSGLPSPLVTFTSGSDFTITGSAHTDFIDLRGFPGNGYGPYWSNGETARGTDRRLEPHKTLAIGFSVGAHGSASAINSVTWFGMR